MSKLRTLIIGKTFRCKECFTEFNPDPSDPKCPKCGRRFREEEMIAKIEKSYESTIEI